jgi:hypothetical protein
VENALDQAPDLELVEELVARTAGSDLAVTLRLEGAREAFPVQVLQATARIVREDLTTRRGRCRLSAEDQSL